MTEAVLIDAVRTPVGKAFKGAFAQTRPDDLGVFALQGLLKRTGVDPTHVQDLLVGCAMTEGPHAHNFARQIGVLAGLPDESAAATVNRFCASSAYTIGMANMTIQSGQGDVIVAGGAESMSMVPMQGLAPETIPNPRMLASRPSYYNNMGLTAEQVAKDYNVSREDQDHWGVRSHNRAEEAQKAGRFADEIVRVDVTDAEANTLTEVKHDEGIRYGSTYEATSRLKPAFIEDGTVTAGNSSQMSDGAAMALLASKDYAEEHGLTPKARVLGTAVAGVPPEVMGLGPIPAVRKLQERTGFKWDDIKRFEVNEAFASQTLASIRELGVPEEIVNPDGGAIALGHPLGATGGRIAATLVHGLGRDGGGLGIETMCVGGGQGYAVLYEVF